MLAPPPNDPPLRRARVVWGEMEYWPDSGGPWISREQRLLISERPPLGRGLPRGPGVIRPHRLPYELIFCLAPLV